ncbi:DUF4157 domain-containing protein [Spirulina sp. CCNP1310]|uniref:eCIS core domain-containing protein n=1 Tax=Spirulina sp. CCNP1310 TaxID=3110249 RepID=UPI002B1F89B2|nr:DUF4157 domain-containing protein [Spirulina sp. CCNP1310]MEA5420031.1 DUF4157 domain-containing protein [Spirulina sp. CCNP1310]
MAIKTTQTRSADHSARSTAKASTAPIPSSTNNLPTGAILNNVQPKLALGKPGDKYEREADQVAAQVVQQMHAPTPLPPSPPTDGGEHPLQRRFLQAQGAPVGPVDADFEQNLKQAGTGQPLARQIQAKMGAAMGADFSNIKVHTNPEADSLNRAIQAKAFTTGPNIYFREGAYQPGSKSGQELIAHELTHTLQQGAVRRQVIQRADTLKGSDAQTTVGKDNKVTKEEKEQTLALIKSGAVTSALDHPMYAKFKARLTSFFQQFPPPANEDINTLAETIWTKIYTGIQSSSPEMERRADNTTYSNVSKGFVDMESAGYKKALTEFDDVMGVLKKAAQSQFMKAKSFGFWSKPEGREFAEKMCDVTLETSGIGALFDGMPSIDAHDNGWDAQLWGSLSRAFGEVAAQEMKVKGKTVHVCAGGGTDKKNVFGAVESKALEKGAGELGYTLEEMVVFHAIAAKAQDRDGRKVDWSVREGAMKLPGTWYSGSNWDESLRVGKKRFDALPATLTPVATAGV